MVLATLLLLSSQTQVVFASDLATNELVSITHVAGDGTVHADPATLAPILMPVLRSNVQVDVQTTAHMTSQIAGGYRWQVHVEVKVGASTTKPSDAFSFKVPVVLQYERLNDVDAVRAASAGIGRKFTQEWLQLKH